MKRNMRTAYNALKKIGCPVIKNEWDHSDFRISGEDNGEVCWADYYCEFPGGALDDFGVNNKINAILDANGLFAEWNNPGMLGVYQA
jgi:hypothetical protein|tara:strand:+ start:908 stop:1168 length:261 start_codon:yes stop_codon:yes gene_type:complete